MLCCSLPELEIRLYYVHLHLIQYRWNFTSSTAPLAHVIWALGWSMIVMTKEFNSLTRSVTPSAPPSSYDELTSIALALRERVELGPQQLFRLVGVGLSNFQLDVESPLFENGDIQVSAVLSV